MPTFASVNLNGAVSKREELTAAALTLNLTTICLQETKLTTKKVTTATTLIKGFNTWRLDRTANGGSVAVLGIV